MKTLAREPIEMPDPQENHVIDWDTALRTANRWHDRMVAISRTSDRRTRERLHDQVEKELHPLRKYLFRSGEEREDFAKPLLGPGKLKVERGKLLSDFWFFVNCGAYRKVLDSGDRAEQQQRSITLAFALATYQRDQGSYPKELKALVPKYLETIPQDLFSSKELIYRPSETGYLLYSVGINGRTTAAEPTAKSRLAAMISLSACRCRH